MTTATICETTGASSAHEPARATTAPPETGIGVDAEPRGQRVPDILENTQRLGLLPPRGQLPAGQLPEGQLPEGQLADRSRALGSRPRLVTRALLLRFMSILGAETSFYLLLSVVPLYAKAAGTGGNAAGLATGALMLTSVAGELASPRLLARYGYRLPLAAGLLLLGAPAFLLTVSASMVSIMAVCLLRGLGFGITVVAGGALTASIIPAERRGEGLALTGVVAGVPAVVALPLGIWLTGHVGYPAVFAAGAVAALAALGAVPGLPDRDPDKTDRDLDKEAAPDHEATSRRAAAGVVASLRTTTLARPAIVFSATTVAGGIIVTFLPLAVVRGSGSLAALALFALQAAATLARWLAGRYGDRHGSAGLLLPGLLATAAGTLALVFANTPAAALGGAVLFGAGFGVIQNATLTLMYSRVTASGYGMVSALWNLAYDAGWGLGAAGFGVIAVHTGYPVGFAVTAGLVLAALAPARRDRKAGASSPS